MLSWDVWVKNNVSISAMADYLLLHYSRGWIIFFLVILAPIDAFLIFVALDLPNLSTLARILLFTIPLSLFLLLFSLVKKLVDRTPQVILDKFGIIDRQGKLGKIPWADIKSADITKLNGGEFLALEFHDINCLLTRRKVVCSWGYRLSSLMLGGHLTIGLNLLDGDHTELLRTARAFIAQANDGQIPDSPSQSVA